MYDYKIKTNYEGKDVEAGHVKLYESTKQMMASLYPPENVGPEEVTWIPMLVLTSKIKKGA